MGFFRQRLSGHFLRCASTFLCFVIVLSASGHVLANDSAGSAYGESVQLTLDPVVGVTVGVTSGPFPMVSGATPPDFNESDNAASVLVDAEVTNLITDYLVTVLSTGVLEVETQGDGTPNVDSMATVDDLDLTLLESGLLTLLFGLSADTVTSTASIDGVCGALDANGDTVLENAVASGTLSTLAGVSGSVTANPAPNFVLIDLDLGVLGQLSVILNEQIVGGDGVTSASITVNAIHVSISDLLLDSIIGIDGDIIIAQSTAEATCDQADLSITKSDSPDPVEEGETLTYTLMVSNSGPDAAENVQVEDTLPGGVSFVSANPSQGSCMQASGTVSCDLGTIANGGNATVTIEVIPGADGQLSNTATVASDAYDDDPSDNSDTETTTVTESAGSADISVQKSDSPDPVTVGETLTYTITVSNAGPDAANNVMVTDALPAGVTYDSATPSQGSCQEAGGTVTCNLGTISGGGNANVVIEVTPIQVGQIVNTASADADEGDPDDGNNSDSETTTVDPLMADLSMNKTDGPDPVLEDESLTYTLTVNNAGPDEAENVVVTDVLPGGVTYVSATPSQGSCQHAAGTVTCNLGTLANGANATVSIEVTPDEDGMLSNTASVDSDAEDPDPGDNSDSEDTTVEPAPGAADLGVTKTDSPDPVTVGETLTYTITVSNAGPDDATNVQVVDQLPAGVSFDTATPSQGSCGEAAGTVTCDLGNVASGAGATVTITVIPGTAGQVVNTVVVDADEGDPDDGNNQDSATTEVEEAVASADLGLVKTDGPDPVQEGETLTYTLTVSNAGPDTAEGVVVEDTLPSGVSFVSANASQGSCQLAGDMLTCQLGSLANGGSAMVTIEVEPLDDGQLSNTASVSSDSEDPDASDNSDTEDTTVSAAPGSADLSMDKSADQQSVMVGETLTYTLTASNAGPDEATGVTVIDTLPASVSFGSATPSQGSCQHAGGTVTCLIGTLAPGANATVTIEVTPNASGQVINTAVVDGDQGDPDDGNNEDTTETDIEPSPDGSDVRVVKQSSPNPATVGEPLTYSLYVSNQGPGEATGVTVIDALPSSVDYQSVSTSQGSCSEAGGTVSCDVGDMAVGANVTITIIVVPNSAGTVINTAEVTNNEDDPDPTDDTSTEITTVNTDPPPSAPPGSGEGIPIPTLSQWVSWLFAATLLLIGLLKLNRVPQPRRPHTRRRMID